MMKKIYPFLELCRPFTSGLTSLAVAAAILIEVGQSIHLFLNETLIAVVAIFLFSSAGNVLNDYFDREIDKANHPERPIPSKRVDAKDALKFSIALFLLSMAFAFFLNTFCIVLALLAFMLQILYELKFKKHYLSKNFTIAFLTGLLFIYGGASVKGFDVVFAISSCFIFGILAFLAIFGREIVKDMEDFRGDADRLTLPKKIGAENAGIVAAIFLLLSVALSPIPYLYLKFNVFFLFLVSVTDLLFLYSIFIQYKHPKKARKVIKIGMLIALVAFIVGNF